MYISRIQFKRIATIAALICVMGAPEVSGADYIPLTEGYEWVYACESGEKRAFVWQPMTFGGHEVIPLIFYWSKHQRRTYYIVEDTDGPMLVGYEYGTASYFGPDYGWFIESWDTLFTEAIRLFDLPPVPGTNLFDIVETSRVTIGILRTMGEESLIQTPLGTFSAYHFSLQILFGGDDMSMSLYLNRQIGPIGHGECLLASHNVPVSTESKSWGAVKSLYR